MLEFFIYYIFVAFGVQNFSTNHWHFNGKDCAPLLVDLFVYSYDVEFIIKTKDLQTLMSLISLSGILMMFCQSRIQTFLIVFHYYTPKNLRLKNQLFLPHFLTFTSYLTPMVSFYQSLWLKTRLQFCHYKVFTSW